MAKYRKRPVLVDATQWLKNGDHPEDYKDERPFMEHGQMSMKPGSFFQEHGWEGAVVRYFRRPDVPGSVSCEVCGSDMHAHGWIDTPEGGHRVCPGDWVITGVLGEHYPCKPEIFALTYEGVE